MSGRNVSKLALRCCVLMLLTLSAYSFSQESTQSLLTQAGQEQKQPPKVEVARQDDVPLRILLTSVESAEPQNFRLQLTAQNQSGKEVRAYAVTIRTSTGKNENGNTSFVNLTQPERVWQPTEIRAITVGDTQEEPILSASLLIDFVEFSDGTTWGPDTNKSQDILAGQRAGARAEKQRLLQLLKKQGRAAVVKDIQEGAESEASAEPNRSRQWLNGFRNGANSVRRRLKDALQSKRWEQLEVELGKPFDTSGEGK